MQGPAYLERRSHDRHTHTGYYTYSSLKITALPLLFRYDQVTISTHRLACGVLKKKPSSLQNFHQEKKKGKSGVVRTTRRRRRTLEGLSVPDVCCYCLSPPFLWRTGGGRGAREGRREEERKGESSLTTHLPKEGESVEQGHTASRKKKELSRTFCRDVIHRLPAAPHAKLSSLSPRKPFQSH